MAVQTLLVDDIDGSVADRTLRYIVDGVVREIDLSEKNIAAFEAAIAPFVAVSRTPVVKASTAKGKSGREDLAEIREWAASVGIEVSQRGRISAEVVAAYGAAKSGAAVQTELPTEEVAAEASGKRK